MDNPGLFVVSRDLVDLEILRLKRSNLRSLNFSPLLEEHFERSTARERSRRLWLEGLIAIIAFNACLLYDFLILTDPVWKLLLRQTMMITPLALVVNMIMLCNPRRWIREGSVACGVTLICLANLMVQQGSTASRAGFGLICALVMALFANVTMRLRFLYAAAVTVTMMTAAVWFAFHATGLIGEEKTISSSIVIIGFIVTLTAGYSLERQERESYLLLERSKLQSAELHRISNLDKLTGLPNRRSFEEQFEAFWHDGLERSTCLSTVVVDIDHFKVLNDVYGHLYGDEVLRQIAGKLGQGLRVPKDFAARFGGEEFVILLPDTMREEALGVAERVRALVASAGLPIPGRASETQTLEITVSCGVSTCVPHQELAREQLLKSADRALYKAKSNGRNRVEFNAYDNPSKSEIRLPGRSSSGMRLLSKLRGTYESGLRKAV